MSITRPWLAATFTLLLCASGAQAQLSVSAHTYRNVGSFTFYNPEKTGGELDGTSGPLVYHTGVQPDQYGVAAADAGVDYGSFRLGAGSALNSSVTEPRSYAQAQADASWTDTLTVTSAVLPEGTPVTLLFLNYANGFEARDGSDTSTNVRFDFFVQTGGQSSAGISGGSFDGRGFTGNGTYPLKPLQYNVTVGDTVEMVADASIDANVSRGNVGPFLSEDATIDFQHTFGSYAQSLTSGVLLVSGSGHNYAPPQSVPEGSALTELFVLAGVMGSYWKRKRVWRKPKLEDEGC